MTVERTFWNGRPLAVLTRINGAWRVYLPPSRSQLTDSRRIVSPTPTHQRIR